MKWLRFILSHSIFISFCAVALCYQSYELLHLPANYFVYGFVFSSTLCSYNFYWIISKYHFRENARIIDFFIRHSSNFFFFLIAGLGMLYCLYFIPQLLLQVLIAVVLTLLYSVPLWPITQFAFIRKAGFLKTILLAFTWTYVTVILPFSLKGFTPGIPISLLFMARFLFVLMLCIIFDSRDIAIDKNHALNSLATDVSRQTLQKIMATVFIFYIATGFILRYYFDDIFQVMAFIVTGLLTLFIYTLSLKPRNYFFYYFVVDGMMLFSALATYVASI